MTITFGFQLGEHVKIQAISSRATVEGARVCGIGVYCPASTPNEYLVSYWLNGEREATWLPQTELEKV
jgi:hypothetical protein